MCVKNGESREEDNYEKEIFRNRSDRSFERNVPVRVRGDELNLAIRQFGHHRIESVAARTAYSYNFNHGVGRTVHVGFKCLFHQLLYLHYASRDIRSAKLVNSKFNRFFLRGKFKKFRGFSFYFQSEEIGRCVFLPFFLLKPSCTMLIFRNFRKSTV